MYSHTPDNGRSVFGIWSRSVCTSDQPTMKFCIDHNDVIWNIIRVELVVNPVLPKIFWITSENYFKRWCFSSQPLFSIVTQRVWEGIWVTRPNNNGCDHPWQLNLTACQVYKTVKSGSARGGSGIPIYPKKNRQNTPKYPKFLQIYPKIIKALNTLYLKFKESDILNTHI